MTSSLRRPSFPVYLDFRLYVLLSVCEYVCFLFRYSLIFCLAQFIVIHDRCAISSDGDVSRSAEVYRMIKHTR